MKRSKLNCPPAHRIASTRCSMTRASCTRSSVVSSSSGGTGTPCRRLPVSSRDMTGAAANGLDGRVALVTGGARRVGAEIVRALHGAGARVLIHCHTSGEAARALAAELNATRPASAAMLEADLLDAQAPTRLIEGTLERYGQLDILVNNASTFYATPIGRIGAA